LGGTAQLRRYRRFVTGTALAATLALVPAVGAQAQTAPNCVIGQTPTFVLGFASLRQVVGDAMGDAIECEHANPDNGDTLQRTTTGLSFYRKSTNTPTFTNGSEHWGLTEDGLVFWTGSSIDPPGVGVPASGPAAQPAPSSGPEPAPAPIVTTPAAPGAPDASTTPAGNPAVAPAPSIGTPIAFQTISEPFGFASIQASLDPRKT
jgi:hypothetical protein